MLYIMLFEEDAVENFFTTTNYEDEREKIIIYVAQSTELK